MKKTVIKPQITIAICAFNEEENILLVLRSLLMQKQQGFLIKDIWVVSDGSTDKTEQIVKSFKSKKITLLAKSKRLGKSYRLNEIYQKLQSDILVQIDADVVLTHENVLSSLVKPLHKGTSIHLTGGQTKPLDPSTFTEKAVYLTTSMYKNLGIQKNHGNNIYSVSGKILALTNTLAKQIVIPQASANDAFVYFSCLKNGYSYRYVSDATVLYRLPQTLRDHTRQNIRYTKATKVMKEFFPEELIRNEYFLSAKSILLAMFQNIFMHPILGTYIFLVNSYCRIKAYLFAKDHTSIWTIAVSTKRLQL